MGWCLGPCPGGVQCPGRGRGGQTQARGVCVSACTEADTSTPSASRRLLLRTVRIPLDIILVKSSDDFRVDFFPLQARDGE